jgi:plastocyanin
MTRRLALIAIVGAAAVGITATVAAPATDGVPRLVGVTGPAWTITLKRSGRVVTRLKPGTYSLTVTDRASIHNFRLRGPGMNRQITPLRFVGRKTVTVKLRKGRYTYLCDPHEYGGMKGEFVVR